MQQDITSLTFENKKIPTAQKFLDQISGNNCTDKGKKGIKQIHQRKH